MILFRADGNGQIGTGHIMRCLSIATALRAREEEVTFLLADVSMQGMIEERGFHTTILNTSYDCLEDELPQISSYLEGATLLVVDSYYVTKEYLEQVGRLVKVVYIDDLMKVPVSVPYLINYNCYANIEVYNQKGISCEETLTGLTYVPLREEFQSSCYQVRNTCRKILITTGGADEYNIAGQLLERMSEQVEFAELELVVVAGVFNQHRAQLESLAKKNHKITICHNVGRMSELMASCDIAISAAGSTLYELCAIGIATVSFSFAENQNQMTDTMHERDLIASGGHYQEEGSIVIERVLGEVTQLLHSYEMRCERCEKCRSLVDGNGASRIASKMIEWSRRGE